MPHYRIEGVGGYAFSRWHTIRSCRKYGMTETTKFLITAIAALVGSGLGTTGETRGMATRKTSCAKHILRGDSGKKQWLSGGRHRRLPLAPTGRRRTSEIADSVARRTRSASPSGI
jgi:hypothetical protein